MTKFIFDDNKNININLNSETQSCKVGPYIVLNTDNIAKEIAMQVKCDSVSEEDIDEKIDSLVSSIHENIYYKTHKLVFRKKSERLVSPIL